ncbi:hypothetical protein B0J17DRAFT_682133 [Rhizoctonia solani]|nr:hypothetical protein B0J17DRAFT_682133 [Rhizoctonia solani]
MSAEPREHMRTEHRQACLVSLADAADTLAKAAATLAAAARAAVQAFSIETPMSPEIQENQGINLGRGPDDVYVPDLDEKVDMSRPSSLDATSGEGAENHATGSGEQYALISASASTSKQGSENTKQVNQPYRLLVDAEMDVLLTLCALIDKRQRVICYLPCGTNPLGAYKQLIESVTETSVHILTSTTSSKQEQAYVDFPENADSVLLVPESLSPELKNQGENSWVVHIGWPVSEVQYTLQRSNHRAQNNLLLAYSGDQSLYSSGNSIVELTEPWPKNGSSFQASVSILRPLYEVMLSEISFDMKARVYNDWLQFHGIHGPRRVEGWNASTMVRRANTYLTEAWQWSGLHTGGDAIPFPEVSSGLVVQNGLQSAVQAGLLRVEDDDSDSHTSPPSSMPRPEPTPIKTEFLPTAGHTYFALDEGFDAIPLMCFVASQYGKVICFVEGHGALRHYQKLFAQVALRLIITPGISNNKANEAIEEAVQTFLSAETPAILLLAYTTTNLPPALMAGSVDCCIYWGLNSPLKQAKKNRSLIKCASTTVVLTALQENGVQIFSDLKKHPSAAIALDFTENSALAPMRNRTKSALSSDKGLVRELYINRVYGVGAIPRNSLSAENAAQRANQYAARVLLHGDPEDGSEIFPPIAGRPSVYRLAVEKFKLQPAVEAGLLTVIG